MPLIRRPSVCRSLTPSSGPLGCVARFVTLMIVVSGFSARVCAQSATATLSGTLTDQSDAVVPGVTVTVLHATTGLQRRAVTTGQGGFVFPLLPPGRYSLTAELQGFATLEVPEILLNVGDAIALSLRMTIAKVGETLTVTAEPPRLSTSATVGTVVDRQFVENIPLNGRSFQSLITLTPGVALAPSTTSTNAAGQFSVNGQRASANSFSVDGVSANFGAAPGNFANLQTSGALPGLTAFGTTQSLVSVDAMQEFRVQTSSYSAEYGRQSGGQISIVTRSGTNQLHGSAFDYLRNDVFDANDWFADRAAQPKPPERQNDFGGTFGGPVRIGGLYNGKDRTFFFFSYEGLRLRLPQFNLTNVPSLCLRGQGNCLSGQSPAPSGMLPILNGFPLPNGKDLGNGLAEFSAGYSDPSNLDATSIRIDDMVNKKLTLFARYNKAPSESLARRANIDLSVDTSRRLDTQTITVGATSSLTPKASNELRVNYSSNGAYFVDAIDNFGGATPPPRSALIPGQYDSGSAQGTVNLNFAGRTSASIPFIQVTGNNEVSSQRQFNITDNFSYSAGSHQLKFGVDYRHLTPVAGLSSYLLIATFSSEQQAIAATAGSASVSSTIRMYPVFLNFSAYGQDTWRISRRLTLDLGVRWDVNPAPSEANGRLPVAVNEINNLATMQLAPLGTKEWKTSYNNVAPRLGVAYQVSQAPRRETVVRGGVGLFFDTGNDQSAQNFNQGFPYASSQIVANVSYPLSPTQVAPAPLSIQAGITPPYNTFVAFDPGLRLPYTLQWNAALEQSLGISQALTISYVGAAGRRLLQFTQFNLRTINPSFTNLNLTRNTATSDYNALQAQFQRRLSRGLQALVSYTWSHALDDDSASNSFFVAQRGNAAFDIRHVFAAAATYDIPAPSNRPLARAILSHWSVDTSVRAQSALPVDLVARTQTNPADGSLTDSRPNVNPGVPFYLDDPTLPCGRRINAAAFSIPSAGQSGNLGRNALRGCAAWQVDMALHRTLPLKNSVSLQLRAEAFNIFNHPNFGTIQTTLTAANFGQPTNMLNRQLGGISQLYQIGGPRSFQFALKILF
jgi:hypothetical protein